MDHLFDFVPDVIDVPESVDRTQHDPMAAAKEIIELSKRRLDDLLGDGARVGLMLSGGIDSIFLAALLKGRDDVTSVCITSDRFGDEESRRAQQAASWAGLDHKDVRLDDAQVFESCSRASGALETTDVWEVLAGMSTRVAFDHLPDDALVLTGAGADALYCGGREIFSVCSSLDDPRASEAIDTWQHDEITRTLTYHRDIPDHHKRILGEDECRLVKFYSTIPIYQHAITLGPHALFGPPAQSGVDKRFLRLAALELGVPDRLVWSPKSPMQRSSGLMEVFSHQTKRRVADQSSNPSSVLSEDDSVTLARIGMNETLSR